MTFCLSFSAPYAPVGSVGVLFPGTWYLTAVDDKHRREYAVFDGKTAAESPVAEPVGDLLLSLILCGSITYN